MRLSVLYKRSGYPDAVIDTLVRRTPEDVYITFKIKEGDPIRVTPSRLPAWIRCRPGCVDRAAGSAPPGR